MGSIDRWAVRYTRKRCPVCYRSFHPSWIKRHLVANHNYRYTEESPNYPLSPFQRGEVDEWGNKIIEEGSK